MSSVVNGPVLNPVDYLNQKRRNEMPISEYLENRPQIQVEVVLIPGLLLLA